MSPELATTLRKIADPAEPLAKAYDLCAGVISNGLFTAMSFHEETMEVERLYSTLPATYPVGGRKPKRQTEWGDKVLPQRQTNLGFGPEDIAWAFSDHETILGLGLETVLNVPVVRGDRVLGTINCLRAGLAFNEDEAATGRILAASLALRGGTLELSSDRARASGWDQLP